MLAFYNEIFYRPVLNGLVFLTTALPGHDLGLAVILLTVIVRLLMFPLAHKMLKTQKIMQRLDPEIKKINADKKNKEDQSKALMELYRAHGINPFSGFLAMLIQFPLLIALYQVFWKGIPFELQAIYSFLTVPAEINILFLGLVVLTKPNIIFAALAAVSQFFQARLAMPPKKNSLPKNDFASAMQSQMVYFFPILIFFLGFTMPAAVSLYWTSMNIFAIVHEAMVRRNADFASK